MIEVIAKIKFPAKLNDDGKTCSPKCENLDYECGGHEGWCTVDNEELFAFGGEPEARQECRNAAKELKYEHH